MERLATGERLNSQWRLRQPVMTTGHWNRHRLGTRATLRGCSASRRLDVERFGLAFDHAP
jgi:hypothetical protein